MANGGMKGGGNAFTLLLNHPCPWSFMMRTFSFSVTSPSITSGDLNRFKTSEPLYMLSVPSVCLECLSLSFFAQIPTHPPKCDSRFIFLHWENFAVLRDNRKGFSSHISPFTLLSLTTIDLFICVNH